MIGSLLSHWNANPSILLGLAVLSVVFWLYSHEPGQAPGSSARRRGWFFTWAVVLALVGLVSPLDWLADHYLFSAHMVQHLILMLGVAPLLALAVPPALAADLQRWLPAWLGRVALHPVAVLAAFVVIMWGWHAPPLYEATLRYEPVHMLEHMSFMGVAALFWWIAFAPLPELPHLPMLGRVGYVFVAGIPNTILGALITFAPSVLYPSYQRALEQPGTGRALQLEWGVTALADQELGGLIMWVPGGLVYLVVIVAIFLSWFASRPAADPETA